jgi:tetratricopeptide (TPR) repeat protein
LRIDAVWFARPRFAFILHPILSAKRLFGVMMVSRMRTWILLLTSLPLLAKTPEWERAHSLYQAAEFKQAISVLEKASKKDPDNLALLGQSYLELKKYGDAVDALESATELAPKNSDFHMWLGRAWGRLAESNKLLAFGRARKAKNAFETAVQLDPKNVDALSDLFEYYLEAPGVVGGGLDKAEKVAKMIRAIDPEHGDRLLARVAEERKK